MRLLTEVLRALMARHEPPQLLAALGPDEARRVALNEKGVRYVDVFAFTPAQVRFARGKLDGSQSVKDVVQAPIGARAALEVIYCLKLVDGLSFAAAPRPQTGTISAQKTAGQSALQRMYADLQSKNHFEVLGLHWSSPPRAIPPAVKGLRDLYGPGGTRQKEDPGACTRIWQRIEQANAILSSTVDRRRYRREAYSLVWSQQADLLLEHAKIAIYRGARAEARDTLEAVMDFHPTDAAKELLARVTSGQDVED
jgi:hypothetical protein